LPVPDDLTLADALVGEVLIFFAAFDKAERGELSLEEVDARIDNIAIVVQSLDVARGNPETWSDHLVAWTSSYDHLWPAERTLLYLLANYSAYHSAMRQEIDLPLISPESIARELLSLAWLPQEVSGEEVLAAFLAHPASQVPEVG
jgi:hypothetical protein